MQDIRIERWARTLVNYCLYIKEGDIVAIQAGPTAAPLVEAVYREVLRVGAHPLPQISLESLEEILLRDGSSSQLAWLPPTAEVLAEKVNARLSISSSSNTKALSGIAPDRSALRRKALASTRSISTRREQTKDFRWCLTLYPTQAYAQDANMSLADFEEFVFNACYLNDENPTAQWQNISAKQQHLVDWLKGHKQVHVLGEGTDLTLSIEDRVFINSDGKRNFPSGEFFTGPVENSANGVISYEIPTTYDGHAVEGIRLVFREGKVVEATARQGQEVLNHMLDIDEGARYLGEFAFGNNSRIQRGIKNILFDEKIGGTVHLALGNSYPETGGLNHSALHWDMICDLRTTGEVWVDDTLFLKDGKLLLA